MSASLMSRCFTIELSQSERTVLIAYADHVTEGDADAVAFPSREYLEWKTDFNERYLRRIIRALIAANLLVPLGSSKGGRWHGIAYSVRPENGTSKQAFTKAKAKEVPADYYANRGLQTPVDTEKGGQQGSTEPGSTDPCSDSQQGSTVPETGVYSTGNRGLQYRDIYKVPVSESPLESSTESPQRARSGESAQLSGVASPFGEEPVGKGPNAVDIWYAVSREANGGVCEELTHRQRAFAEWALREVGLDRYAYGVNYYHSSRAEPYYAEHGWPFGVYKAQFRRIQKFADEEMGLVTVRSRPESAFKSGRKQSAADINQRIAQAAREGGIVE